MARHRIRIRTPIRIVVVNVVTADDTDCESSSQARLELELEELQEMDWPIGGSGSRADWRMCALESETGGQVAQIGQVNGMESPSRVMTAAIQASLLIMRPVINREISSDERTFQRLRGKKRNWEGKINVIQFTLIYINNSNI